jgi:group I intron endonuclease
MAVRLTGVYLIRNNVTGKVYVGSASHSLLGRIRHHRDRLHLGLHHNRHLQRAWRRYGAKAFTFRILAHCPPDRCLTLEQEYIDRLRAADPRYGYNISPTAGNSRGVKHTEEFRRKVSENLRGRVASPETRAKRSASLMGHSVGDEARAKMSKAKTGKVYGAETRAKVGAASRRRWETHTRVLTEEARAKTAAAAKARPPMSAETRAKVAAAGRGRKHSEETKEKIRQANTGRTVSPETRAKISETHRIRNRQRAE